MKSFLKNQFQQNSGVLGVVILWVSILFAMSRTGLGLIDSRPFSYLGVDVLSAELFTFGLLTSAILFLVFGFYLRRKFGVKNRFLLYFVIGQIGQLIVGIAPYGLQSPQRQFHTIAAFVIAFSLPFLMHAYAKSQSASQYYRIYTWLFWLEVLLLVVGLSIFIFTKGIAPLGQAMPTVGFHLWIIVLTFISIKFKDVRN